MADRELWRARHRGGREDCRGWPPVSLQPLVNERERGRDHLYERRAAGQRARAYTTEVDVSREHEHVVPGAHQHSHEIGVLREIRESPVGEIAAPTGRLG